MASPGPQPSEWIALAAIGRPHGVQGELRVHPFNRDSDLLHEAPEVTLRITEGAHAGRESIVSIENIRPTSDAWLLKLAGVDDRTAAEGLRGAHLCVRRGDFPPLDEGEFYVCDVIGAEVWLADQNVGVVRDLLAYPSVDVLVFEGPTGTWEVPLVDGYVAEVDVPQRRITLHTLEGLEPNPAPRAE